VAVLERNTEWLRDNLLRSLREQSPHQLQYFCQGLEKGRWQSSREVRQRAQFLQESRGLDAEDAQKLAETGLADEQLPAPGPGLAAEVDLLYYHWQLGATLRDMAVAAQHAAHVVKSVKYLATQESAIEPQLDVNQSISEALILLSSPLRKVDVKLNLGELPPIAASKGELVQVWSNLIRNAVESIAAEGSRKGEIVITSQANGEVIQVAVQDNGPGIPQRVLPKIFQPNFTTKEQGLEFGLGLGLTIVERIVSNYGGRLSVQSEPGRTVFTVTLPIRGGYGKAKGVVH
jgi:signal transduction histidine kinase